MQSCYIPWKGYFDLVNAVDEFILYDDRQFTRRDWRSRNTVKAAGGPIWLTIPTRTKGHYHQRVDETLVDGTKWREKHWRTLVQSYRRAPHFEIYAGRLERLYLESDELRLSAINRAFIETICEAIGISTPFRWSTDYEAEGDRSERLLSLVLAAGATRYLSGPRAQAYLDEGLFERNGVEVEYFDYSGYPEYPQPHPPFVHTVSALDLLFSVGPDAKRYMKTFREDATECPSTT